jgi:hypothetical protein
MRKSSFFIRIYLNIRILDERSSTGKKGKEYEKIVSNDIIELCKTNNDNCNDEKTLQYYKKLYDYNNDLKRYNNLIDTYQSKLHNYNIINNADIKYQEEYKKLIYIYNENVKKHTFTKSLFVNKLFDSYDAYLYDVEKKLFINPNDDNLKELNILKALLQYRLETKYEKPKYLKLLTSTKKHLKNQLNLLNLSN